MGSELHSCELLKKKGESLPETNEMKALLLKQLTASSKVLENEKQKCMAEMLKLPKTCKDETEAVDKQKEAADLAGKVQDFLKAWRKEVAVHKKYLEQEIAQTAHNRLCIHDAHPWWLEKGPPCSSATGPFFVQLWLVRHYSACTFANKNSSLCSYLCKPS